MATPDVTIKSKIGLFQTPHANKKLNTGQNSRYLVLHYLTLCANRRGRAWPFQHTIAEDLKLGRTAVNRILKWLVDVNAIYIVPNQKRIESEDRTRGHVYQLTGLVFLEGKWYSYLYMSQADKDRMMAEIQAIRGGADVQDMNMQEPDTSSQNESDDVQNMNMQEPDTCSQGESDDVQNMNTSCSQDEHPHIDIKAKELQPPEIKGSAGGQNDDDIVAIYAAEFGRMPGNMLGMEIIAATDEYGFENVKQAILTASQNGAEKWSYVKAILKRWKSEGKDTPTPAAQPTPSESPKLTALRAALKRLEPSWSDEKILLMPPNILVSDLINRPADQLTADEHAIIKALTSVAS